MGPDRLMTRFRSLSIPVAVGTVIPLRRQAASRYHPAALDRLIDELERRRRLRAEARSIAAVPRLALVVPFPGADR